jgi:hypothetical protein
MTEVSIAGSPALAGRIGEEVASYHLRSLGFIVARPWRVLRVLERAGVPDNYEVEFLRRYQQTMDYFAIKPRDDPLLQPREAMCEIFRGGGLDRYMSVHASSEASRGYVTEVKTWVTGGNQGSRASKRQQRMFREAEKLGFGAMLVLVALRSGLTAQVEVRVLSAP